MIKFIKDGFTVKVDATIKQLKTLRKLTLDSFTISDPNFKQIQNRYYYFNNKLSSMNPDENGYKEILLKKNNLETYLRYNNGTISFYHINEKLNIHSFGIGFLRMVKKILKENNIRFKIIENFSYPEIKIDKNDFNRNYQYKAIKSFFKRKYGIIKLPTGSGKTEISRQAINILNKNTPLLENKLRVCFIVEQSDLLLQTRDSFIFDNLDSNQIGLYGQKYKDADSIITICTVQSLLAFKKSNRKKYNEFCKTQFMIIVDECELFTSDKRTSIIKDFLHSKYRLFLSATPFSRFETIKEMKMIEISGGVIFTAKDEDLIEDGFLSEQKAFFIDNYNIYCHNGKNKWLDVYKNQLVENKHRNNLILEIYNVLLSLNMKALFVVEQEEHGKILSSKLGISFYKGSNSIEERKDVINRIQDGSEKMVITTRIFRRAINIPELQVYINCAGYKSDGITIQAKGRITRKTETKVKGIYIDFFDYGNKYLEYHSEEREKTMVLNNISQIRIDVKNLESEIKKFIED